MKKVEVTTRGETKNIFYFNEIKNLDITRTAKSEKFDREEFTVVVNMQKEMAFGYNLEENKLYIDVQDSDANIAQLDKMAELTEGLDKKNPDDKNKIQEIIDEHYIQYVQRWEAIIHYGEFGRTKNLADVVNDFIVDNNL